MAMSLIQGGPSPNFLTPSIAWYFANGLEGLNPSVKELPHDDMKEAWQEVIS